MADLEGIVRKGISRGLSKEEILWRVVDEIVFYKDLKWDTASKYALTVYDETLSSLKACGGDIDPILRRILCPSDSGVSAGIVGIGSRGSGDFFFHRLLAGVASWGSSEGSAMDLDDAGWVRIGDMWIVVAVDGIHSRLSYFPLIAGFHAARAAARDVMVKGAVPVSFAVDLRIGDDGDPSYLLDLEAGVAAVSKYLGAPIVGGSTLRIGGDMVIGTRVVGTVMCVGVSKNRPKARRYARPGDKILMTMGAGGGTVATTAIYGGKPEVVLRTLNFNTLGALRTIIESDVVDKIHAMFDITNGGIRGDLNEISRSSGVGFLIDLEEIYSLIDSEVLRMLRELDIDPLGISLDSIAIIAEKDILEDIERLLKSRGIESRIIGEVISEPKVLYRDPEGKVEELKTYHRESPYTKIKKLVGIEKPENWETVSKRLEEAYRKALEVRDRLYSIAIGQTRS
ncbi:MAG: AIR synthase-related protein [Sulfolobales archaeon]